MIDDSCLFLVQITNIKRTNDTGGGNKGSPQAGGYVPQQSRKTKTASSCGVENDVNTA